MPRIRKSASPKTHDQRRRTVKMPRAAKTVLKTLSLPSKATLVGGVAAAAAATGAIVMHRRLGRLAAEAASEAISAGHSVGRRGERLLNAMRGEVKRMDLSHLLAYAGLKRRPSILRRLAAPLGILAAVVAAAGSALFLIAPKLSAAGEALKPVAEGGLSARSKSDVETNSVGPSNHRSSARPGGEAGSHAAG